MSEEATEASAVPALNVERFKEFDAKFPAMTECPVCGCEKWFILQDDSGSIAAMPMVGRDNHVVMRGQRMAVLSCQRCGFVRMHNLDTLNKYMEGMDNDR